MSCICLAILEAGEAGISLVDCLRYVLWCNACLIMKNFLSLLPLWRGFFLFFHKLNFLFKLHFLTGDCVMIMPI